MSTKSIKSKTSTASKYKDQIDEILRSPYLPEKRMKQILQAYLISKGWDTKVSFGRKIINDIEAKRGNERWIIQVKGVKAQNSGPNDSFVAVLGEVLVRMHDPACKYSIALPDAKPFHRLWERLPILVKDRTGITVLFVNNSGNITESI